MTCIHSKLIIKDNKLNSYFKYCSILYIYIYIYICTCKAKKTHVLPE
jgi:hypothetical protein